LPRTPKTQQGRGRSATGATASNARREQRRAEVRDRAAREQRRRSLPFLGLAVLATAVLGAVVLVLQPWAGREPAAAPPPGVETFANLDRSHTSAPVNYPQTPPVGGPHAPVWQNCGFYDAPIANEIGVHSLEHGAVWITYQPSLLPVQRDALRSLATSQSYVLVTPYPGLGSPVVASAWGAQLALDSLDDPRLQQFIRAYRNGPQTPEPGAPCTGGTGSPG
jgi:hypothetical protein